MLANESPNAAEVEIHIDAVSDGLIMAVLHNQVLIEKSKGLF